jgi:methionyl-tRNA formyltransferase
VTALSDRREGGITVACGDGTVVLTRVLPEGKSAMSAADLIRGRRIALGDLLS